MSSFNFANKLNPSKKAWKSFTIHLKTNFHNNFNISKTIKATKKQFISALLTIRSLISRKIFDLTTRSWRRCPYHLSHPHRCQSPLMKTFKNVNSDKLLFNNNNNNNNNSFEKQENVDKETSSVASSSSISLPKVDGDKLATKEHVYITTKQVKFLANETGDISKSMAHHDDEYRFKLSLLSKFRGIDERAEEFISRFKEDMKLQKEKSIIDYQEMLTRSV